MTVSGVFVQRSGRASRASASWPPVNQTPMSLWGAGRRKYRAGVTFPPRRGRRFLQAPGSVSRRFDLRVSGAAALFYENPPPRVMKTLPGLDKRPSDLGQHNLITPHRGVFARSSLSRLLVTPDTADFSPIWGAGVDTPTLVHSGQRFAELRTRPQVLGCALKLTAWGPSAPKGARQG